AIARSRSSSRCAGRSRPPAPPPWSGTGTSIVSEGLRFLFGVHNHQPVGNFDSVVLEAAARAYHPFLEAAGAVEGMVVAVHCSGGLLAFLRERAPATFDLLGRLVSSGRVEILTGGFYEPILAMLPDEDKVGQIQALTEFLRANFGVRPRGMWLAERVWEPQLPRILRRAGVEFVLLDDAHFALAGLEPESLGGYYLTEEQGDRLAVFPISQRLRYLVPFAAAAEELEETRRRLETLPDGARLTRLLRGGFWRNFLVKYPEMGDAYAIMLALSRRLHEALRARPDDPRLQAAREDLWRGQANDAYWHGVFGGCYLPHLRRAVKSALVAAERILDEAGPRSAVEWTREDINGDGREEIRARTRELTVTLRPEAGGTVSELAFRPLDLDVAGVFTRRPEAYHGLVKDRLGVADITGTKTIHSSPTVKEDGLQKLLDYDPWRRASLLEGFFPPGDPPDPLNPWAEARLALGERAFHARVSA